MPRSVAHTGTTRPLTELRQKAKDLGASDSRIIAVDRISIEDGIIEMCKEPLCEGYGKSAHCPPHVESPEEAREGLHRFSAALVFKIHVPPEDLFSEKGVESFRTVYRICSGVERLCVQEGLLPSRALAAGSCKPVFCKGLPCEALKPQGQCRFPELARPSMEALGINVFRLVGDLGWEIHPIRRDSDPKKIPSAMLAGMVLVG